MGAVLALGGVQFVRTAGAAYLPRINELEVDASVLIVGLAISLGAGMVSGAGGAFLVRRTEIDSVLTGAYAVLQGQAPRAWRLLHTFVILQVAASIAVLIGVGQCVRHYVQLSGRDVGYDPGDAVTLRVQERDRMGAGLKGFVESSLNRLRSTPGVQAVAVALSLPFEVGDAIAGMTGPAIPANSDVNVRVVTPGYLESAGLRLRSGRFFDDNDTDRVIVVDQGYVGLHSSGSDVIGSSIVISPSVLGVAPWRIVGVVERVASTEAEFARPIRDLYLPLSRWPDDNPEGFRIADVAGQLHYIVRAEGDAIGRTGVFSELIRGGDPNILIDQIARLRDLQFAETFGPRRAAIIATVFAAITLFLVAVGAYGVVAYAVDRRTRELGIRVAIGAVPRQAVLLVTRRVWVVASVGIVLGTLSATWVGQLLEGVLVGLEPVDVTLCVSAAATLLGVVGVASYWPARRAARLEPVVALREQ